MVAIRAHSHAYRQSLSFGSQDLAEVVAGPAEQRVHGITLAAIEEDPVHQLAKTEACCGWSISNRGMAVNSRMGFPVPVDICIRS